MDNLTTERYLKYLSDETNKVVKRENFNDEVEYEIEKLKCSLDNIDNIKTLIRRDKIKKLLKKNEDKNRS